MIGPWRRWTLRTRLMTIGLLGLAVAQAIGSVGLYAALSVENLRRVDRAADATSTEVSALVTTGQLPQTLPVAGVEIVQVLDPQGRVVSASVNSDRLTAILRPAEVRRARSNPITVAGSRLGLSSRLRVRATDVDAGDARRTVIVAEPVDDLVGNGGTLRTVLLVSFPVILLLLGAIAWRVIGAALRPVEALRSAAEGISGSGGDDLLPVPESDDEIHALATTLNSMLARLSDAREREAGFVADAAHELRSPLASMRMQIDVARRLGEHGNTLDELDLDVSRMSALVDDLLTLAMIDAGATTTSADVADVSTSIQRVAAGWPAETVQVQVAEESTLSARMRAEDLERVVVNLVSNAATHAATVRVSAEHAGEWILIRVDDDGPGIPEADRESVFDRFTRLDDARDRDAGGTGLGLAIVRGLVRAQGGEVRLTDSPLGGLRAEVTLPEGS